ncbi:MAG: hypothetical protein FJ278_22555, partial [Planctomycetes bacterium]|nr:hypothetical protein [Planctomycetota bacterium]
MHSMPLEVMRVMTVARLAFVLLALGLGSALAEPAPGVDILPYGDMETRREDGSVVGWSAQVLRNGKGTHALDNRVAHSGTHSLRIEGAPVNAGHCLWQSAQVSIRVQEETEVDLSVWIKAADSPWVMVRLVTWDEQGQFGDYLTPFSIETGGFFDWKEFRKTMTLKPGARRLAVYLVQPRSGTVWFDDVRLVARKDIRSGVPEKAVTSAPRSRATALDLLDLSDYIRNPRMAGPAGEDGLPHGWTTHNPAGEETMGKASWSVDDPRPGAFAISLAWLGGGRYFAVQPELVRQVTGEAPFTLLGYVRTATGGKAYFRVQCLDAAGKLVMEKDSDPVENAADYATLKLDFLSH